MILGIDIGNTTITFGVIRGQRILKTYLIELSLSNAQRRKKVAQVIRKVKRQHSPIEDAVLCSVVPGISKGVASVVLKELGIKTKLIGRDIKVPLKNNYRKPNQVGQDRLVGAYAAKMMYGQPLIIIDLGTAITFDVISDKGAYEGGMIVPGIQLSAQSLFQKTALLPRIELIKPPRTLIGKDTRESILSGLFNGYGVMCNGLIDSISRKIKGKPKVIVTGGYAPMMEKFILRKITKIEKDLVFKGIALLSSS